MIYEVTGMCHSQNTLGCKLIMNTLEEMLVELQAFCVVIWEKVI